MLREAPSNTCNFTIFLSVVKQGQKLVLSDALAVQSQGPKVLSAKVVFGSQQMFWDLKECFGISKMYWQLESQKKLTLSTLLTLFSYAFSFAYFLFIFPYAFFFMHFFF